VCARPVVLHPGQSISKASDESAIAKKAKLVKVGSDALRPDDAKAKVKKKKSSDKDKVEKKKGGKKFKGTRHVAVMSPGLVLTAHLRLYTGPVDVDTQCGVINDKGLPCQRSLTCKTHSMGAKRSVPGRSAPYDVLLNEWQKRNNPNLANKKPTVPRVGPGSTEAAAAKRAKRVRKNDGSLATNEPKIFGDLDASDRSDADNDYDDEARIDSDREVEHVLVSVSNSAARPFARPRLSAFVVRDAKLGRFRDAVVQAFSRNTAAAAAMGPPPVTSSSTTHLG
jgi:hypothetical protein